MNSTPPPPDCIPVISTELSITFFSISEAMIGAASGGLSVPTEQPTESELSMLLKNRLLVIAPPLRNCVPLPNETNRLPWAVIGGGLVQPLKLPPPGSATSIAQLLM